MGKNHVKKNALKHGLTGAGIVVPDEDVAVIQDRFEQFDTNLNPLGVVSEYLVRYLAMLSVRMERAARQEAAHLTSYMLLADQAEADAHRDELQALVDRISEDPEAAYRKLPRSPRGIAWMIGEWEYLKVDLADPTPYRWNPARIERAKNLIGHRYASPQRSRIGVLSEAYLGHFSHLNQDDWPDLPAGDRQLAARAELGRIIDGEITRLKEIQEKLDREALAKIESGAKTRALFDPSKGAELARKYAGAAERAFFKTLKTILELNALAIANQLAENQDVKPIPEKDPEKLALNLKSGERTSPVAGFGEKPPGPEPSGRPKPELGRGRRPVKSGPDPLRE